MNTDETDTDPPLLERSCTPRGDAPANSNGRLVSATLPSRTIVAAPAGFGKTTLLSDWFTGTEGEGLPTAWVWPASNTRADMVPTRHGFTLGAAPGRVVQTATAGPRSRARTRSG